MARPFRFGVMTNGGTNSFAVFIAGTGSIADMPAVNRIFVAFKDASGTLRGETSVAVRTH